MTRWSAAILLAASFFGLMRFMSARGAQGLQTTGSTPQKTAPPAEEKPLQLPKGWSPADPLPFQKSNCVRCHLKAGRELTTPVRDFARSIHDRNRLSCNDCHGGNTDEDGSAHEEQHGFIGTKLSAHMAACADCHSRQAQTFRKGKHYWDLTKSINRKYPVCIDCHGNHDVGKPPAEFSLMNVCTDCHKQFAKDMPHTAAVVTENDRLWVVLRKVYAKDTKVENPAPEAFQDEIERLRARTARLMHHATPITAEDAKGLNEQVNRLREGLEDWLKKQR
jgi:hypothetical protein